MKDSDRLFYLVEYMNEFLPRKSTDIKLNNFSRNNKQGAASDIYTINISYDLEGTKQQKDFILKCYRKGHENKGLTEFRLLRTLKKYNLPVPTAYHFEADGGLLGAPFTIMERIIGEPVSHSLNNTATDQVLIEKMAKNLANLHKLNPNHVPNHQVLKEKYDSEQHKILETARAIRMSFLRLYPSHKRRFLIALKQIEQKKPQKFRAAFLHMDYEPNHVLLINEQAIIIDWEQARVGDPAFDVGWAYHLLRLGWKNSKTDLGEHFVKSYEKYANERLINLQLQKDIAALKIAFWAGLPYYRCGKFINFGKIFELMCGYIYGRIIDAQEQARLQKLMATHHTNNIWLKFNKIHNYAIQYFEKDRYSST